MSTTVYDDVLRTMLNKYDRLFIPLINEIFHTDYPEDVEIIHLRNEYVDFEGKVITDSILLIEGKLYHIECQSNRDGMMSIRMIEYDFKIALEHARTEEYESWMEFPESCVLYLRHYSNTPDELKVHVKFQDGQEVVYMTPIIKVQEYTREELFSKKLLVLLPYYILRYEKEGDRGELTENSAALKRMIDDYEVIIKKMEHAISAEQNIMLMDLLKLMERIAEYVFPENEPVKKGLGDVMGGRVLELESERLFREGKTEGREEGLLEGRAEGREEGRAEAKKIMAIRLSEMGMPLGQIAEAARVSMETVRGWISGTPEVIR